MAVSAQSGRDTRALIRDVDKLSLLLTEFKVKHPDAAAPLAYVCAQRRSAGMRWPRARPPPHIRSRSRC